MDTRDVVRSMSIHTAIWDIFKWIPELLEDKDVVINWESRVLLKTNFELFKNSAMAPVFEHTRLEQMHLLGSAVWVELTMLTNCMQIICSLIWHDGDYNPYREWADKHFAIKSEDSDEVIYQTDVVATEMTAELKQMEVWS
jgi:hypothetical protein